jgi:HEAT repeat protein
LIRYLGRDEQFNEIAIQALRDTSDDVRIQAIQAIAFGMEKTEAIELISPMLQDEIYNVQATASQSLMDLRDAIHEVKADG